ncbi:S8 family serine peptidase [Bacteroidota bacterium]
MKAFPHLRFTIVFTVILICSTSLFGQVKKLELKSRTVVSSKDQVDNLELLQNNLYKSHYYCLIQLSEIPGISLQQQMKESGISLFEYVGSNTYIASLTKEGLSAIENFNIIWAVHAILPQDKIHPTLLANMPSFAIPKEGFLDVSIMWFPPIEAGHIREEIQKLDLKLLEFSPNLKSFTARIPVNRINELVKLPWLYWMETVHIPCAINNLPGRTSHRSNVLSSTASGGRNLTGDGVRVGIWDAGQVGQHIDFDDRLTVRETDYPVHTHATHCNGTIGGAGILDEYYQGMSTKPLMYSWDFYGPIPYEMDTARIYDSITITSNSYVYTPSEDTCNHRGFYDDFSYLMDRLVTMYPDYMHVFAAGNSQSQCGLGGFRTVSSGPHSSKNALVVGAVNYADNITYFSSWGPVRDGRLKPEVTSVGLNVKSTLPGNTYSGNWNGTSMACPGTAGTIVQLYEGYKQIYGTFPDAAVIKAILCNTALDLGNAGPDFKYGFGRIDGLKTMEAIEDVEFKIDSVANSQTIVDTLVIGPNVSKLKILLCYSDVPTSPYIPYDSTTLINHLNLKVLNTSNQSWHPLVLNPFYPDSIAKERIDTLNNTQQVVIDTPAAGAYYIAVQGSLIPAGKQRYCITWHEIKDSIVVTYPGGGESLTPGDVETIRWNASGNTGYYTIEFSSDSGSNWQTLNAYVPANRLYYNWTVPAVVSGKCLVRVSSGNNLSGQSQHCFSIMNRPELFYSKSCKNQVHLFWNPTDYAASYDVFHVVNGQWKFQDHIADTCYTVYGLADTIKHYFSIRAYDSSGGASRKSPALEVFTDSTVYPASFTIQPLGDTICNTSSVTFISSVTGTPGIFKQWEFSADLGQSWQEITGANDTFLTLPSVSDSMDGYLYRMSISNSCRDIILSNTALLRVPTYFTLLKNPDNITVCYDQPYSFTARFENFVPFNMQWEVSQDNGQSWNQVNGMTDTVLSMTSATLNYDQALFRLRATDFCQYDTISSSGRLSVRQPLQVQITKSKDTVCYGLGITLTAQASGGDLMNYTYFWHELNSTAITVTDTPLVNSWYHVDVFDSCSVSPVTDSVYIIVRDPLRVSISSTADTICYGNTVSLNASPSGGDHYYSYYWNAGNPSAKNIQLIPQSSFFYSVILIDGCANEVAIDTYFVFVRDPLSVSIIPNEDSICFGQQLLLTAFASGGDSSAYRYLWKPGGDSNISYSEFPDSAAMYSVQLTDNCSSGPAKDSLLIFIYPQLQVQLLASNHSCDGEEYKLEAQASGGKGNGYHYQWNPSLPDEPTVGLFPVSDSWYKITLSDACNSIPDEDSVYSFINIPNPEWSFTAVHLTLDFEAEDPLAQTYSWLFGDGLSSSQQNPEHTYSEAGQYNVCLQIFDSVGCIDTLCKQISVSDIGIKSSSDPTLFIFPNPNQGEFIIQTRKFPPGDYSLKLYNTIGESILVLQFHITADTKIPVRINDAPKGLHVIELMNGNILFRQKFIIY